MEIEADRIGFDVVDASEQRRIPQSVRRRVCLQLGRDPLQGVVERHVAELAAESIEGGVDRQDPSVRALRSERPRERQKRRRTRSEPDLLEEPTTGDPFQRRTPLCSWRKPWGPPIVRKPGESVPRARGDPNRRALCRGQA